MSDNFEKHLNQILGQDVDDLDASTEEDEKEIEPMAPVIYDPKSSNVELHEGDLKEDYNTARSNMYGLLGKTNAALELTLKIAMMSEHPRALEVASNLIKTSSDISKDILQLHKSLEQKQQKGEDGKYQQINNYYHSKEDKENTESVINDLPDNDED